MIVGAAEALLDACLYEPERLPHALEESSRLLGYDYFCLVAADLTRPRFIASDRQREGVAAWFSGGWSGVDYRVHAERTVPRGALYLDHVHVDQVLRRDSAIFNEFYRPRDMASYAGIRFEIDGQEWFCSASRGDSRGEFSTLEAEAFTRVARTAMRVAALSVRVGNERAAGILDGLEVSQTAAILLNRDGRVRELTSAARALLGEDFNVRQGRLWAAAPDDADMIDALDRLACAPFSQPKTFVLRGRANARPLRIEASMITGRGLDDLPGARLLLVLSDLGAANRDFADELRRRFVLSPAEADVVAQFAEGHSIVEIAAHRGVAESTIREQMKSIYVKTGVHRQVDLLRLLGRLRP